MFFFVFYFTSTFYQKQIKEATNVTISARNTDYKRFSYMVVSGAEGRQSFLLALYIYLYIYTHIYINNLSLAINSPLYLE